MNAGPLILGILTVLVSAITGIWGLRNSSRANKQSAGNAIEVNRQAEGAQHLAWVKQAMDEAKNAKDEAAEARAEVRAIRAEQAQLRQEASDAMADMTAARRQARQMTGHLSEVMNWVDRVVRAAANARSEQISDPKVIRLLAIINGGPPEISGSRLTREDQDYAG